MTLYSNYYLKCISQNPFRILGVSAKAPKKEIIANINKYRAFLRVGKSIVGSYDSIPGIHRVNRCVETIVSADKSLELPTDQLRWSLFWFVNITPIDKIALNHIQSGNIEKAIEIWSKVESVSSLINIVVSELVQQNWVEAVLHADKLFSNYGLSICSLVDKTLNLSQQQLMRLFVGTIAEDNYNVLRAMYRAFPKCYSFEELVSEGEYRFLSKPESIDLTTGLHYPCLEVKKHGRIVYYEFPESKELTENQFITSKDNLIFIHTSYNSIYKIQLIYNREDVIIPSKLWNTCICETLAAPYIDKVKIEIATYKSIPKENIEDRYKYAKSMMFLHYLPEIYGYLGDDNTEYWTLNNQIIKEVLQCAIDYFNSFHVPDDIARDVKDFVWSITTTAIPGSLLRQRCEENYDTLCDICSKLPPESVKYYHTLLKGIIDKYRSEASTIQSASIFVRDCFPYLMSIRSVLGSSNIYYQKMCTRVAEDALEDIITDYNKKSEFLHNRLEKASSSNHSDIIKLIQEMIKSAVITMYHLKKLDLESDFRQNRFSKNYDIIVKQARNARVLRASGVLAILGVEVSEEEFNNDLKKYGPDLRDEKDYFSSSKNLQDCYIYIKKFPDGKYTDLVNSKIEEYEYTECSSFEDLQKFSIRYPSTKYDIEAKREEISFKACKTIEDYKSYIAKYSTYKKKAEKCIDDLIFGMCLDRASYMHYLITYPYGGHRLDAQQKIEDIDFRGCKTAEDFEEYLKSYPHGCHVADAKIHMEEEKFWALCVKKDSWKLYKKYLNKYPNGKYNSEAKKKSKSPKEKFIEWRSNNGCLFTLIIILLIVLITAAITNGILGLGVVFSVIGVICLLGSIEKGDLGCGFRIACLGIGVAIGGVGIGLISIGEDLSKASQAKDSYNSLSDQSSVKEYRNVIREHYHSLNVTQQDDALKSH